MKMLVLLSIAVTAPAHAGAGDAVLVSAHLGTSIDTDSRTLVVPEIGVELGSVHGLYIGLRGRSASVPDDTTAVLLADALNSSADQIRWQDRSAELQVGYAVGEATSASGPRVRVGPTVRVGGNTAVSALAELQVVPDYNHYAMAGIFSSAGWAFNASRASWYELRVNAVVLSPITAGGASLRDDPESVLTQEGARFRRRDLIGAGARIWGDAIGTWGPVRASAELGLQQYTRSRRSREMVVEGAGQNPVDPHAAIRVGVVL